MAQHSWLLLALVLYAIAGLTSALALFVDREELDATASWSLRGGFFAQTLLLLIRWMAWRAHPPWCSLYETLLFFSWCMIAVPVLEDFRGRTRGLTALIVGLAASVLALAWMSPDKGIDPVSTQMQTSLLWLHPPLGILAYGSFTASAAFSLFVLLRDKVKTDTLLFAFSVVAVALIPFAGGKDFYGSMAGLTFGWSAFGGFSTHVFLSALWLLLPIPAGRPAESPFLAASGEKIGVFQAMLRLFFLLSLGSLVVAAISLVPVLEEARGHTILFGACSLVALAAAGLCFALALRLRPVIEARLPSMAYLDRLAYQWTIVAFLFTGCCLFLGMIWAFLFSGSYWTWDAKEVWTLSLWVYCGIYLVARHRPVPAHPRALAVLSCVGFFLALFTYLGVSLLMTASTYHLFGAA
jgi:ABC-type transport system involved in cytochrome c biogenesis permease subunit